MSVSVMQRYTRQDAIDDGVLCEMDDVMLASSTLFLPTVVTHTLMKALREHVLASLSAGEQQDTLAINQAWTDATRALLRQCAVRAREAGATWEHESDDRIMVLWEGRTVIAEIGPDDRGNPSWSIMLEEDD